MALLKMPYSYYGFMRIVVFLASLATLAFEFSASLTNKRKEYSGIWILGLLGIAILFNPIIPLRFPRDIWALIDIGAAVLFLLYYFLYDLGSGREDIVDSYGPHDGVISDLDGHRNVLKKALQTAKRKIVISSPYLSRNAISADNIGRQVREAVSRGVEVKVICNRNLALNDLPLFEECVIFLRRSGAQVYYLEEHSKFIFVDDDWIVMGSFNWLSSSRNPDSIYSMGESSFLYSGERASSMISDWCKKAISIQRASI